MRIERDDLLAVLKRDVAELAHGVACHVLRASANLHGCEFLVLGEVDRADGLGHSVNYEQRLVAGREQERIGRAADGHDIFNLPAVG